MHALELTAESKPVFLHCTNKKDFYTCGWELLMLLQRKDCHMSEMILQFICMCPLAKSLTFQCNSLILILGKHMFLCMCVSWRIEGWVKQKTSLASWNVPNCWRHWSVLHGIAGTNKHAVYLTKETTTSDPPFVALKAQLPIFQYLHKPQTAREQAITTAVRSLQ